MLTGSTESDGAVTSSKKFVQILPKNEVMKKVDKTTIILFLPFFLFLFFHRSYFIFCLFYTSFIIFRRRKFSFLILLLLTFIFFYMFYYYIQVKLCLLYLRERIGVPRDMTVHGARQFRAHINWFIEIIDTENA